MPSGGSGNSRLILNLAAAMVAGLAIFSAAACRSADTTLTGPSGSKCTVALSYVGGVLPATAGSLTIGLTAGRECSWSVSNSTPWLTVSPASGQGNASIPVTFTENPSTTQRQAPITIGDQTIMLIQAGTACTYSIEPQSASVPSTAGSLSVSVTAQAGCSWNALSEVPWLSAVTEGPGAGAGQVTVNVQSNGGAQRSGTVTIASQAFTVTQASAPIATTCTYGISPSNRSIGAGGGSGSFSVTSASGCSWNATSTASWIDVSSGSGSGSGTVGYSIEANTGSSRSAAIIVAGQSFDISQASGAPSCVYSVNPRSRSFDQGGGASTVSVSVADGCDWTASSSVSWVRITGGASDRGSGTVTFTVEANSGGSRTTTLTVAGQTVQITQSGCSYSIAPTTLAVGAGGGPGSAAVSAQSGCSWTATSGDSWISISSGSSGSGAGTVSFVVAANSGGARSGALTVAGQRFTVNQAAAPVACSFSVSPSTRNLAATGGTSNVDVTTSSTCSWSASVSESWVRITSGASGIGSGRVEFDVQANGSTTGRFATLTAAGQSVSISQAGAACTYAVSPSSRSFAAAGGSGSITVTAPGGCAWVAASGAAWIRLTGATSGSGNGTVSFSVEANNSGTSRSASITIQGITISISQIP